MRAILLAAGVVCLAASSDAQVAPDPEAPKTGPYWPEWALRELPAEASAGDIAAALNWVSRQVGVPCIVVSDGEGGGSPAWLGQPATLDGDWQLVAAVGYWARQHAHIGFVTPRAIVVVPRGNAEPAAGLRESSYGLRSSVVGLAMATAPLDVAAHMAAGARVLVQQLSEEARACLVRGNVIGRSRQGYPDPLQTPLGLAVSIEPLLRFESDAQGGTHLARFSLGPGLRQRGEALIRALGFPRAMIFDNQTRGFTVTEWGPDKGGDFPGNPPPELVESVAEFQADWAAARRRLHALQQIELEFGGPARLGDICRGITACRVDPGPFADVGLWATPGRAPAGSALQCLALAVRASIVAEGDGLRLAEPDGYAIPEPVKVGLRWASAQLPEREDLRLACLAIDDGPLRPFGELDPATRDTVRACIAASEQPPTIVDTTMVRLEPLLIHSTQRLLLTRDETASANQTGSVRLRVSPRFGSTVAFSGDRCTHVPVDPYVLDLLP